MKSKYPFILVHGIAIKDYKFIKAFGRIEKVLKNNGYVVFTAQTDGFGTIENNAQQLKDEINKILIETNSEKINIIAHSKGGLDSKYMITKLDMDNKVATLTTLCTPHKGSKIATKLLKLPKFLIKFIAFWINLIYKIFKDKKPDSLTVCKQLQSVDKIEIDTLNINPNIYCQSYSTTLNKSTDDFLMGIPLIFSKYFEKDNSDGMVSTSSAIFANYKGNAINDSISHSQIVDFMVSKKKKEKIYAFYLAVCEELASKGY